MVKCRECRPYWHACMNFCTTALGETKPMMNVELAIIFNMSSQLDLLGELTRAFLRHAVRWWYASMTAVLKEKRIFIWQSCYHMTLVKFREAVIRNCHSIRIHYVHRTYTQLTEVIPEKERERYANVAKIQIDGRYTIAVALVNEITRAAAMKTAAGG